MEESIKMPSTMVATGESGGGWGGLGYVVS